MFSLLLTVSKLTELSIKPIHQIDYTKGKNATDMAIVIDAMDLLHLGKISSIALVSSDSDFTPLAMKLLEEGLKVYVFGNSGTPPSLKNACSIFTDIDSLLKHDVKQTKSDPHKAGDRLSKSELKTKIVSIFNNVSPDNAEITMETFNREIKAQGIDFKTYGFKQLRVFVDDLNLFQLRINEKSQGFVKLKAVKDSATTRILQDALIQNKKLINAIVEAFNVLIDGKDDINMSTFFNVLSLKHGFNHKEYGYGTFKDFMIELGLFDIITKNDNPYIKPNAKFLPFKLQA